MSKPNEALRLTVLDEAERVFHQAQELALRAQQMIEDLKKLIGDKS